MKKFFTGLTIFLSIGLFLFIMGLCIWCEKKHDKSLYQYVQDKIKDKDDTETTDEVVTESEDGTVEATAVINF